MTKRANAKWNLRYVAYSRAHGRDPAAMLEHDKREHPAGCMVGFVCWINDRWREFEPDLEKRRFRHAEFDAWLQQKVAGILSAAESPGSAIPTFSPAVRGTHLPEQDPN